MAVVAVTVAAYRMDAVLALMAFDELENRLCCAFRACWKLDEQDLTADLVCESIETT